MVKVEVLGLRQQHADSQIVVLLLDTTSELVVPIVIGPREASAIAMAQADLPSLRPMTYDLIRDLLEATGIHVNTAEIIGLSGGVFFAELVLSNGTRVDSRASDAIAIAICTHSPVLCSTQIIATAGIEVADIAQQDEMKQFRDFLDNINPDDFA